MPIRECTAAQVQAAVRHLGMEHGEYVPLGLLLATSRLGDEDYGAGREGRLGVLMPLAARARLIVAVVSHATP